MLKIGITGGIGSGKTVVCKLFESCGAPVYDADEAAKRLMQENSSLKSQLIASFGNIYDEKGKLQRSALAEIVFNDTELLSKLNGLVHPAVMKDYKEWQNNQKFDYVIRESAILFESNTNVDLDYVIMVEAPELLRIQRTMQRDQRSEKQIRSIMEKQMPDDEKIKLADFVIINNEVQPLLPQVWNLHEKFMNGKS